MHIPFARIDAFADRPFAGNPAAVMPLPAWLDDVLLQRIATENDLSETAFLVPHAGAEADFDLRWFTPAIEVTLCGHATLASGHMVLAAMPALERVRFATRRSGILEVARADDGYALRLPSLPPASRVDAVRQDRVGAALQKPPTEVWARGQDYLLAVFDDPAEVRGLAPDFAAIKALAPGIDLMLIATAPGDDTDVISRVFVPAAGIDEDPVTGSAHSVLTPFWSQRFGRPDFTAYQASSRGGRLGCRLDGESVVLTGRCRTVVQGEFRLDL